jgi:cytoskeletal protein CcmA (bactofilin family)
MGKDGALPEGCVNPLAVSALILLVGFMLAIPLIPSLGELRNKSDAKPLNVIQEHAGEIRHFANGFRNYIGSVKENYEQCVATETTARGVLNDGCEYLILGKRVGADELLIRKDTCDVVIVAGTDFTAPDATIFSRELYAGAPFFGGVGNTYRAILGEKTVHLGAYTRVMRWVHAVKDFSAEDGCELYGRISSDQAIRLSPDTHFLRLNAPHIELGPVSPSDRRVSPGPEAFTNTQTRIVHRLLYDGDYEIGEGEVVTGSIVARGRLLIRAGARVLGSAKSHHELILENGVSVEGSLISASSMRIGTNCSVHGPIIAERRMKIAAGTCCGTATQPTTVSSPRIDVESGVVMYGTVWARERGRVLAEL